MYYGLKQGQITPNVENRYVLKLIHLVAQYSKITNTVLFLIRILHHFSAFCCFLLVMSEGTFCRVEVHIKYDFTMKHMYVNIICILSILKFIVSRPLC